MSLNPKQLKLARQVTSGFKFPLFLIRSLPIGWIAGLRVRKLSSESCTTSVPFKYLTKNPFKSTYFAVQSMAAELSTATPCLLAITGKKPSVAFIIVDLKASFSKKATDRVYLVFQTTRIIDPLKGYLSDQISIDLLFFQAYPLCFEKL